MYYSAYPEAYPHPTLSAETVGIPHTLEEALSLDGLRQAVTPTLYRFDTVIGTDGQEYTELTPYTL
jgi:hypothetical protein